MENAINLQILAVSTWAIHGQGIIHCYLQIKGKILKAKLSCLNFGEVENIGNNRL